MVEEIHKETSSLRTLKIKPRSINEIVHSWIRLPNRVLFYPLQRTAALLFLKERILIAIIIHEYWIYFLSSFCVSNNDNSSSATKNEQ